MVPMNYIPSLVWSGRKKLYSCRETGNSLNVTSAKYIFFRADNINYYLVQSGTTIEIEIFYAKHTHHHDPFFLFTEVTTGSRW